MIGPMKKKVITSSVVTAVILIAVFAVIAFIYVSNSSKQIAELKVESQVVERYVFSGDFLAGHVIDENDIKLVKVKAESAPANSAKYEIVNVDGIEVVQDDKEIVVGSRLRVNVLDKTIVTSSMFFDQDGEPDKDERMQEFNMITLPSNLGIGDFVDIRIRLATGEDYIVLTGKKIEDFGATGALSNTIFLKLNEEEIIRMSSAIIESYIDEGINLYANRYVEPTTQLFDYKKVNLVEEYNKNRYIVLDAETSGEVAERRERTNLELAELLGITPSEVEEMKKAIQEDNATILAKYNNKTVATKKSIETTYPVRTEVANLIKNNPNLLETIKQKYDIASLEAQRSGFMKEEDRKTTIVDEYGNVTTKDDKTKFNERIKSEIDRQKAERQEYLRSLLGISATTTTTTDESEEN